MANKTKDREIVVSKVIDAPRETVFAAFTERQHMENWWLPSGSKTHEIDVKPGGVWRYSQPGRDGLLFPFIVKFVEIDKPERFVYDFRPDLENAPDVRTNVTFEEEENGKTRVTLQLVFATVADREQAMQYGGAAGAQQALKALADYLATL
jgi:uncharacterized protein YndB with AHSA1/START domain